VQLLTGKVAVVTGAASGIGLGLATRFAAEGMNVVMSDIEGGALDKAARSVQGAATAGAKVLAVVADVSDAASVANLARRAVAAFGKVHVFCANAGVASLGGPAWAESLDDWKWLVGVNLWGVVHGLHAFVPGMIAHGEEGHVVITSSMAGLTAGSSSSYIATKFAGVGIAEGMAGELAALTGDRVGVSVLCPGGVKSMIHSSDRNRPAELAERGQLAPEVRKAREALADPNRTDQASPEFIAGLVVDAIRARQFYILPMQPAYKQRIRKRISDLAQALDASPDTGV